MTRKLRLIPAALAIGLIACVVWIFFHVREPSYQGKPLSAWLQETREYEELGDLFAQTVFDSPPARAVQAIGADGLPVLVRRVRVHDSGFRDYIRALAGRYPWLGLHPRPKGTIWEETAFAFAVLGPAARSVVHQLIPLLQDADPGIRKLAAYSLARIGDDSPDVVQALTSYANRSLQTNIGPNFDQGDRLYAAYALLRLGDAARSALPEITALANDPGGIQASMANGALFKLNNQSVTPLLKPLGNTEDSANWLAAARVLRYAGSNAAPAIPAFVSALCSTNAEIQYYAADILGRLHSAPELCLPAMRTLLRSTNDSIRWSTLHSLRKFKGSPVDSQTIAEIVSCLQDARVPLVRKLATNALRSLSPEDARQAGIEP
jgi:HEAT repeat protein